MDIVVRVAVGAISGVVQYLAPPFMNHISYLFHYKRNANDLRNQMARLREVKVDLERSVDAARMRGEVIKVVVESWLTKVNQMQLEEMALHNALEESKGCLQGGGGCFGCYQVGKDAKHMIDKVNELLNEGRTFAAVSDPSPLPPNLDSMQTLDFQVYDSTKSAMDQIMEALKDENINMVGIYGIGGVGKTTLMKEVGKILKKNGFFDEIVMLTVSQDVVFKNIQGEIAENLGLPLTEEFQSVRARRLLARLKQENHILIVLDDLWKPLNLLDEVGIPCGNNCKVVLTTRQLEVCNQMKVQSKVEIKVLPERDAWVLFKWVAGDCIEDNDMLYPVAKQIVRDCGGLPLAIVTIGKALQSKDRFVWEDAASQLKSTSPPDIEGVHEKVFHSLKLSYDFIASNATKFCFLLCCMFPKNYIIYEDDLLPYVVGEGVFGDIDTLMEARNRLHTQMERLKASCLLSYDSDEWKGHGVRMHDVIRDVSIWIASKEGFDFVVKSGSGLTHWPDREYLWKCKKLSLMQNKITKLPNQLNYSQLMTLSLRENWDLTEIPDGFFQGMISLKTLDLEATSIFSIPSSLSCLTDLRVLRISGYCGSSRLFDVSLLGKLKKLEILHLQNSNVQNLPGEIAELTNLKSLNLSYNQHLTIAPNILSRLSLLEELDLEGSFHKWQIEGSTNGRRACLSEVASLSALTILNLRVSNIKCLCAISLRWENLIRFLVILGNNFFYKYPFVTACTTRVFISGTIPSLSNEVRILLLERAEGLELNVCRGLKYVLSLGARGLNNLRILHVVDCGDIEYLLSTVEAEEVLQMAFSCLEELYLWSVPKLKAICHGSFPRGCFHNLRVLYVRDCDDLVSIIPSNLLAQLSNLEQLQVRYCSGPTELFNSKGLDEGQATMMKLKRLELRELTFLRTIWEGVVSPLSLLNLEEIYVEQLGLNFMFSLTMAHRLQQLKQLEIQRCQKMVHIISMEGDETTQRSSSRQLNSTNNPCLLLPTPIFGNLRLLRIWRCNGLRHILPMSLAQGLSQLEEFLISSCSNLEEIILNDEFVKEAMCKTVFPRLRDLQLHSLPNLSMVRKGVLHHFWPSLETLKVAECPKLTRLPASPQTIKKLRKFVVEEEWFNGLEWDDQNEKLQLQESGKMTFVWC